MSNSNFNITKVKVDPVSQEITELEINGKSVETGGSEVNLEEIVFDESNPLNVATIFGERTIPVEIYPSSDYDGIEKVTINSDGLIGYPDNVPVMLRSTQVISCDLRGTTNPEAEAVNAIFSFDPDSPSSIPLATNIWTGTSTSYLKRNILETRLDASGNHYIYKVTSGGSYPYLKEVI